MIYYLATKLIENKWENTFLYYKGESTHRDLTLVHNDNAAWNELREYMDRQGYMVYYDPSEDKYSVYQLD